MYVAAHLIAYLFEAGPVMQSSAGSGPLTWQEIDAWCNRTGIVLAPWESRQLRLMSMSYAAESQRAQEADCPPPWQGEVTQAQREIVARQVEFALKGRGKK